MARPDLGRDRWRRRRHRAHASSTCARCACRPTTPRPCASGSACSCPARDEAARIGALPRGRARPGQRARPRGPRARRRLDRRHGRRRAGARPAATRGSGCSTGEPAAAAAGSASRTPARSWRRAADRQRAGLRRRRRRARPARASPRPCTLLRDSGLDLLSPYPRQLAETLVGAARAAAAAVVVAHVPAAAPGRDARRARRSPRPTGSSWRVDAEALSAGRRPRRGARRGARRHRAGPRGQGRPAAAAASPTAAGSPPAGCTRAGRRCAEGYTQVAVGGVRLARRRRGRRCRARRRCYVVPPLAALRGSLVGLAGYGAAVAGRYVVAERTGGRAWPDASPTRPRSLLLGLAHRGRRGRGAGAARCAGRAGRCRPDEHLSGPRSSSSGPGWAGWPPPPASPRSATRSTVCEQAAQVGGKLGVARPRRLRLRHRADLLTLPAVYRDLFLATGGPLESDAAARPRRPRLPLPVRRRHRARPARTPRAVTVAAAWDAALGRRGRCGLGRVHATAPAAIWDATREAVPGVAPRRAHGRCSGRPAGCATCGPSRPWRSLRELGAALPAPPAPAHVARPLRHLHRVRPAPRAGRARHRPVRRADVRRLVRARRPAPARATPCSHGRWSAAPSCGPRRRSPGSSSTPPAGACRRPARRRRTPPGRRGRRERGRRPRLRGPAPAAGRPARAARDCAGRRRRCPASSCCSRCAGARPALAHHTRAVPRATTTTSSTRCSAPVRTGAPVRARCRTRRSTSAPRTTPRCARTPTARRGSCWSTPPRHGTRRRRRLGRAGAARGLRRPGRSPCWPRAALDVRDRLLVARGAHARRPRAGDRQRRRLDLRHAAATGPARRSCGRPTAPRCPACSSSAARPTPAAGSRWSACRPRSSRSLVGPP